MSFSFTTDCWMLKIRYTALILRLQRQAKGVQYITVYGRNCLSVNFNNVSQLSHNGIHKDHLDALQYVFHSLWSNT